MKLKYYLRGLGIGIAVTALLCSFLGKPVEQTLTDSEIKERAKALGMVEESLLADVLDEQAEAESALEKEETENASEEVSPEEPAEESTEAMTEEMTEESTKQAAEEPAEQATEEPAEQAAEKSVEEPEGSISGQTGKESEKPPVKRPEEAVKGVEIRVNSGESSVAISKKLEQAGLVSSAAEFDRYLCENGYDKKITTGSHMILPSFSEKEIAEAIIR